MSGYDVDLFVIGAGSGGVRAARIAAGHGAKVMVAEEHRIGGTCVIRGCVPKKLYVYASRFAAEFEEAAGFGWTAPEPSFDFAALKAAKDKEILRLENAYRANLERSGAQAVASRAVIEDAHTVRLLADGRRITAERILIAVGAHPFVPDAMKGCGLVETSNDIFEWESLPKSVVIAGGGYIAVEFACLLGRLGSEVTLVLRADKVLRGFDEDLRDALMAQLPFCGVKVITRTEIASIDGRLGNIAVNLTNDTSVACERVVYATGRIPNTAGLGLLEAGVDLDAGGAVRVDRLSQTSVPSIYAVGDVTNRVNLTPVAIREGHAFADTVYAGRPTEVDHGLVPSAVFTTPEIGTVGLTEAQARARCPVTIFKTSFRPMKATLSGAQERTLMKIVVEKETDRVLGVHIMGEGAGEMIQCLGIAVRMGATKRDFDMTMAVHPTAAEELVTMRTPVSD
ncbi:glutathione-disulfide reductase [Alsobacter soli]|uniref:Glutathione-disulfide reductase n=1 Tax=Alsobacter soli TaxID=2109933 RepID=A0A2T1HVS8_9HYPH|nr:glutathione-disulfide reductase [Alsobacter soli]PSC05735.1 glutathione-disulfide reductase [Alsobacter soli]